MPSTEVVPVRKGLDCNKGGEENLVGFYKKELRKTTGREDSCAKRRRGVPLDQGIAQAQRIQKNWASKEMITSGVVPHSSVEKKYLEGGGKRGSRWEGRFCLLVREAGSAEPNFGLEEEKGGDLIGKKRLVSNSGKKFIKKLPGVVKKKGGAFGKGKGRWELGRPQVFHVGKKKKKVAEGWEN